MGSLEPHQKYDPGSRRGKVQLCVQSGELFQLHDIFGWIEYRNISGAITKSMDDNLDYLYFANVSTRNHLLQLEGITHC